MVTHRKSPQEWQEQLTPEQYRITREKGTDRPFSGDYVDPVAGQDGIYNCICCGEPLFDTKNQYHSGSGWPSFWQPHADDAVAEHKDTSLGMQRIEATCAHCDAHLGHVFPDGPQPTGLR
ncbi:MAG TPA: peptide-methionine (R)-S-oxide reductase MsrB, partial [Gammaproteobacteria bacterium]|nr:peptide-methionine (R)-S-oxide reductase MsrB [Gammaproteobacteria bacterium]